MLDTTQQDIMLIVKRTADISDLHPGEDIYDAGLSSIASLNLLLELEEHFSVSIPDESFMASRTVDQLVAVIDELRIQEPL